MTTPPHLISALEQLDEPAPLTDYSEPLGVDEPEPPTRRQVGQLLELFLEGGESYVVRITNRERIGYERTAARHKEWPPLEVGQNFATTFCCWAAAKRAGRTALTFEAFCDVLEDFEVLQDVAADPTR